MTNEPITPVPSPPQKANATGCLKDQKNNTDWTGRNLGLVTLKASTGSQKCFRTSHVTCCSLSHLSPDLWHQKRFEVLSGSGVFSESNSDFHKAGVKLTMTPQTDTDSDVGFRFTVEETVRTIMKDAHLFFHTDTELCDTGVFPGTVNHEDAATTLLK